MTYIDVELVKQATYRVTVRAATTTTHEVTAEPGYVTRLTENRWSAEELIARSFEFLLQREPNTAILRRFELPIIGQYFPEYEREMEKAVSSEQ